MIKEKYIFLICSLASAGLFVVFYGTKVINPLFTDWLMAGGDLSQHYLGFALFREAPFQAKIGMMNTAAYPFSESVIFTDSIPLLAIPGKIIGKFTSTPFQYFGLFGLICMILMGFLSAVIISRFTKNNAIVFFSSILFTLSPIMLKRIFWHTSLSAHFIIMLGLLFIVCRREYFCTVKSASIAWGLLGVLCAGVHLYFLPMCLTLLFCFIFCTFFDYRRMYNPQDEERIPCITICAFSASSLLLGALLVTYILGGFSSSMDDGAPGLAYYSFNLNAFFNPDGWSCTLPRLSWYTDGQYEGFAYLGLGIITLLIIAIVCSVIYLIKNRFRVNYLACIPFFLATLISVFMAASNEITFGKNLLVKIDLPLRITEIWSVFRASGRLVWPAVYFIVLFSIVIIIRTLKSNIIWPVLLMCTILQLFDLQDIIVSKHMEFSRTEYDYSTVDEDFFDSITEERSIEHIVFFDKDNLSQSDLFAFAKYAAEHNMTINDFYFARCLTHPIKEVAKDFFNHPDDSTIYVITSKSFAEKYKYDLVFYDYGDYAIGLKTPL